MAAAQELSELTVLYKVCVFLIETWDLKRFSFFDCLQRGTLQDELTIRARSRDHMGESRLLDLFLGMCHGVQAIHGATPIALAHRWL